MYELDIIDGGNANSNSHNVLFCIDAQLIIITTEINIDLSIYTVQKFLHHSDIGVDATGSGSVDNHDDCDNKDLFFNLP